MTEPCQALPSGSPDAPPIAASEGGLCSLCGLPVGRAAVSLSLDGEVLPFCCLGCRTVFQVLYNSAEGIPGNFRETELYRACVDAGLIPQSAEDEARRLPRGEPVETCALAADVGQEQHLAQELSLQVEGMWCSACAWVVEQVLNKMRGVLAAKVVFVSDLAQLRYLPHRVRPEELIAGIERLGYRAALFTDGREGTAEQQDLFLRLGVSAILTANIMMISFGLYGGFFADLGAAAISLLSVPLVLLATPVVFYGGYPILRRAALGLRHGGASMDVLIAVGTLAAYLYSVVQMARGSIHLYFDTASMLVTLVLFGKTIEARARNKVSQGVRELQHLARQKVRLSGDGKERWVSADAVNPGDEFLVQEGERVAVDGLILAGRASLDEALLTGEARPVTRVAGAEVMAGSLLLEGTVRFQATRVGSASSLGQMLALLQQALGRKIPVELLADRITRWLVPGVLALAAATAAILWSRGVSGDGALLRALTVLMITCPCALGIATPLARVAAIGAGRAQGIMIRDPGALEQLTTVDVVLFDKTGTLTEGSFALREVVTAGVDRHELLNRAASVELHSHHFLGREIVRQARAGGLTVEPAAEFQELEGWGVQGVTPGIGKVVVGNRECVQAQGLELAATLEECAGRREMEGASCVFCGWEGRVQGVLVLADALRANARSTLEGLQARGIDIGLVSGDSQRTVRAVAEALGIAQHLGQVLPGGKVAAVQELQQQGRRVAMVGDGINDAAALAQADVGLSLGFKANLTHEASDVALMSDDPAKLLTVFRLAARTMQIIRQNLFFAFIYNLLGIPLAIAGWLNPIIAVCAMLASSLTVIANTLRLTRQDPY
jgi:heavy metal translocating P-type ATPase